MSDCKTCRHWEPLRFVGWYAGDDGHVDYEDEIPPDLWGQCLAVDELRAKRSSKFFVTDGSNYAASLKTRFDFGCVEWTKGDQ